MDINSKMLGNGRADGMREFFGQENSLFGALQSLIGIAEQPKGPSQVGHGGNPFVLPAEQQIVVVVAWIIQRDTLLKMSARSTQIAHHHSVMAHDMMGGYFVDRLRLLL